VIDRVEDGTDLVAHMTHRRETRWHCYQERLDFPKRDDGALVCSLKQRCASRVARRAFIERPVERNASRFGVAVAVGWGVDTKPLGNSEPPPGYRGDEG